MSPFPIPAQRPLDCIILARRGSKGVPGKNTALVGGRPCIAWTIDAAKACGAIGHIVVSSDDDDALSIASLMGVAHHRRPANLASDTARVDDAVRDCLHTMRTHTTQPASADGDENGVVILYANVPVRPADLLDRAVQEFSQHPCHSVQSYSSVGKYHPAWMAVLASDQTNADSFTCGAVRPWQGDVLNGGIYRRQDLPPAYIPDGGVLIVSYPALMLKCCPAPTPSPHDFLGAIRRGVISPPGSVVDIDTPIDLLVADVLLVQQLLSPLSGQVNRASSNPSHPLPGFHTGRSHAA